MKTTTSSPQYRLADFERRLRNIVQAAADNATREIGQASTAGILEAHYLHYSPSTPTSEGKLQLFPESVRPSAPWRLASPEGLRCNVPYANYFTWIWERSRHVQGVAYQFAADGSDTEGTAK